MYSIIGRALNRLEFFLLLTSFSIYAQRPNFSASASLSQSSISQWTGDNGLVSNNITSSIRDRRGFVWITSYNGIMRFDGIQVYVYDKAKIPFLSTGAFYAVYEDKDGVLWFASQSSGLIRCRDEKFERIDPENKVLPNSIRCLWISANGVIWIGSNNSGLFRMEGERIQKVDIAELNDRTILDVTVDDRNHVWVGTDGSGLYEYDGNKARHIEGCSASVINSVRMYDKSVLVGTPNGLDILSDGKIVRYPRLIDYPVNRVIVDSFDRIWVGTEIGLARFNMTDETSFEYISEREGFPLSRINFLYFDKENSLWVSTGRDGLVQVRESSIVNIAMKQGLSQDKINTIFEGVDHNFYIASDVGSVDVYQRGEVKAIRLETPLNDVGVRDLYVDPEGTIWIASYRGILKKTRQGERLFGLSDGLPAVDMRRILPGDSGSLWFGTRSGGIVKFKGGKIRARYYKGKGLSSNYILALEKDRDGNIYVGTHSGGMTIIHPDGRLKTFYITSNDAGILIFNIHIDERGGIWAVGNIGLLYFDGKTFRQIKTTEEMKGAIYFDWLEDKIGNVWVTSNVGVLRLKKIDLEKFLRKEIATVDFKLFDNRDGMRGKECTAATRALISSTGKLWVPTISGVSIFFPEKIVDNKVPPPVFVTNLQADNSDIPGPQPRVIEPGRLRYTMNYTAPSFIAPAKTRFKYMLEGVDEDWIDAGTVRQAEYTNLWPGNYVFRVLACNSDGVWATKEAVLNFRVKPFFYQTAVFYVFLVGLAALLLYGAYKWRVNDIERRNSELRKLNDELDRFVYSASHDLRAPLASVLGLVNVARMDEGKNFDEYLRKIETSILKLDGFIRDIIDFSRNARVEVVPEAIDFGSLANEIIDNLKYLDDKNKIRRVVKVEGVGPFLSDKKRISIVLNNLISNAIKYFNPYAQDSFIEVAVHYDQHQAIVRVKDNGIGISNEHITNIFKMFYRGDTRSRGSGIGLYIVKETLDKIKGKIQVHSEYGKGSTFTVFLTSLGDVPLKARPGEEIKE